MKQSPQTDKMEDEHRNAHTEREQRRKLFRVIYPASAAPKILNTDYRVIDLSSEGIKFSCPVCTDGRPKLIKFDRPIDVTLQFREEETTDVQIKVLRCYNDDSCEKCIEAGCDEYLAKPIDRRNLLKIVGKYLPAKESAPVETAASGLER